MYTKRFFLAAFALCAILAVAGCRSTSRCCGSGSSSFAIPAQPCCPPGGAPTVLPPPQ